MSTAPAVPTARQCVDEAVAELQWIVGSAVTATQVRSYIEVVTGRVRVQPENPVA